ncbi:MAG: endonuclease, partial [Bacteroidales bacterium]|nr:endonuclease [Bacteroidales bacterium]
MKHVSTLMAALLVAAALFTVQSCGQKDEDLVVMSYNVRNSRMEDGDNAWDIRKPATAAMLDKINPDIFGVQEAYPEQVEYIREACPRYVSFGVGREDGVSEG